LRYEVDVEATARERTAIRAKRQGWLKENPNLVAERYRAGEIDLLDAVRRYGVIIDQRNGQLLPKTTGQFREMLQRRSAAHWA
jgi:N-methylhydantoinase B